MFFRLVDLLLNIVYIEIENKSYYENSYEGLMLSYSAELLFYSTEDQQKIVSLLELQRDIWNACSEMVYKEKPELVQKTVHHLCYYPLRAAFPNAPAQLVVRAMADVLGTYKTIKSNKHEITEAPKKERLSSRLDVHLCTIKPNATVRLTTLENRIDTKIRLYDKLEEMFAKYKVADPLLYVKNGKVMISFSFTVPCEGMILNPVALGIDLGINNLACTSEGVVYSDKKYLKEKRRLRYNKRMLQKKGTKSARKHLQKIRHWERNRTKNMVHHLSKKILRDTKATVIVLEDLAKIKQNTKRNKEFNNKHSQIPYYLIKQFLSYKAPLYGKKVETVSPAYTSQIDSRTDKKNGNRQKGRYVGKDGKVLHADINASVNIGKRSKLPVSCRSSAIFGQGLVNVPIVCQSPCRVTAALSLTSQLL